MPKTKPLLFEPETASEMDLWAAQQLAALATEEAKHESKWPGQALREAPQAPQIFRGHRSWVPEPMDAPKKPKPAPKIPRNTEPCPLWVAGLIAVGVGGGALLGAAALGWVAYQVVIWIGGVL